MVRLALALALVLASLSARALPAAAAESSTSGPAMPSWLGEELPLPLTVKTPQDIAFKASVERQYLIFNLMAGGKWAFQRGDYPTAVEKWEALLKTPGLDAQVERVVAPALAEARKRARTAPPVPPWRPEPRPETTGAAAPATGSTTAEPAAGTGAGSSAGLASGPSDGITPAHLSHASDTRGVVSGSISGGGQAGPGGAVVWLKRLDGPNPKVTPALGRFITQRDKTFQPHVLAVPVGTTIEFRNEDRIYHNVFSLNRPNDFDAGIRASGSNYSRTFATPGPVEILCNIHSTMNAYVVVIDTPWYTKVKPSGGFVIKGVPAGRYEVSVWHEAASGVARKTVTVGSDGATGVSVSVGGDKRAAPFVPDKYGHKRQPHLGY